MLGGARSGKSRHALALAESLAAKRVYIATAEALDDEMAERIARHIAERDSTWATFEAPVELSAAIEENAGAAVIVVDCLTLWLSNLILSEADLDIEIDTLLRSIQQCPSNLIIVANEVGQGLVPSNELGRRFRDEQGRLNQAVASVSEQVDMIVAGLPLRLKG